MYLKQFKKQKNRTSQGEGNISSVTIEGLLLGHGSNNVITETKENVKSDKIFYHGSNEKFTTFDKSKIKENKLGLCFNFTDDYSIAYQYGDNIVKVHLDLNNPLTLDIWDNVFPFEYFNKFGKLLLNEPDYEYDKQEYEKSPYTFGEMFNIYKMYPEFIQILEEMGYDGIAIPEDHHFGVFEPEQIHIIQDETYSSKGINMNFKRLNEEIEKFLKTLEEQNDQELTVPNKPKLRSMADDIADLASETVKSVGHALTGDIFRKRKSSVNKPKVYTDIKEVPDNTPIANIWKNNDDSYSIYIFKNKKGKLQDAETVKNLDNKRFKTRQAAEKYALNKGYNVHKIVSKLPKF